MYVGVLLILIGWTTGFRTRSLVIYTIVGAILFHLRVLLYEEPWLARTFPGDWPTGESRVPPLAFSRALAPDQTPKFLRTNSERGFRTWKLGVDPFLA